MATKKGSKKSDTIKSGSAPAGSFTVGSNTYRFKSSIKQLRHRNNGDFEIVKVEDAINDQELLNNLVKDGSDMILLVVAD